MNVAYDSLLIIGCSENTFHPSPGVTHDDGETMAIGVQPSESRNINVRVIETRRQHVCFAPCHFLIRKDLQYMMAICGLENSAAGTRTKTPGENGGENAMKDGSDTLVCQA